MGARNEKEGQGISIITMKMRGLSATALGVGGKFIMGNI